MSEPRRRSSTVPPFLIRDNWLDQAIDEARQRGDFDDLPGHGQPLRVETNDLAPEWDMAFRVLKNAGFAPTWMELGKEVESATAAQREFLERTRHDLTERVARAAAEASRRLAGTGAKAAHGEPPAARRRWPFRARRQEATREVAAPTEPNWSALEAERQRARQQYIEREARLDAKIVEYHRELPDDLWRLQRGRRTAEAAARVFDAACPPIPSPAWSPAPEAAPSLAEG
jgi:hypothetical protein